MKIEIVDGTEPIIIDNSSFIYGFLFALICVVIFGMITYK